MRPIPSIIPVLLLTTAALAAEAPDVRLNALIQTERALVPPAIEEGPGAVLAAAAGIDLFPIPCATPLLLAADQSAPGSALRQAMAMIPPPAARPDDRLVATRDGRFLLRIPAPGPAGGPVPGPEFVARVSEALVASRAYLIGTLGYPDPAPAPERLPVVLTPIGRGLEGYTIPARATGRGGSPVIVLDAALPADRIMPAVLHQVGHLALPAAARTAIAWGESTASFLTLAGTGDLEAQSGAIGAWLADSARGLDDDSLLRMQGGLVWPLFLAERTGDVDVVRQIAAEMAEGDLDPAAATDLVLRRGWALSRAGALREMAVWNLWTGSRDDGRHYAAAAGMPEAALLTLGPGLPLAVGPVEPIAAGGSVAFRLLPDGGRGSLEIVIDADGGRPAADLLAFYPGEDSPALLPIDLASGTGRTALPWSEARELWIVLRNDAPGAGPSARFDLNLSRDPLAPFDLASFTAAPAARAVTLEWVTASEKGLLGWNVLRSLSPEGPFARINAVAVPAYGDGAGETGYVFVDGGARPGRRYYYVLEGLTAAGMVERSHVASARADGR